MKFVIPGELPDLNQIIKASKAHWAAYNNMKREYTALVKLSAGRLPKIDKKADIIIRWFAKNKRKDPDNIAAGVKFLLDGLVEAGKLKNDGWNQVNSISHLFEVDKENPRVEVTIYVL